MTALRAWLAAIVTALPCFYLSAILLVSWHDPMAWDDGRWVRFGVGLLALEFIVLHSGAFMAAFAQGEWVSERAPMFLLLLIGFYGLIVWGFATAFDASELLIIFAAIIIGRLLTLFNSAADAKQALMARSAMGIALYVLIGFATVLVDLPELGVTTTVLNEVYPGRGGGLWEQHPERAMVGAALYFALMGLAELTVFRTNCAAMPRAGEA